MSTEITSEHLDACDITLEPTDNRRLANLCGAFDQHLRQLERRLGVEINNRGSSFRVLGDHLPVRAAEEVIRQLYDETEKEALTPARVHLFLQEAGIESALEEEDKDSFQV